MRHHTTNMDVTVATVHFNQTHALIAIATSMGCLAVAAFPGLVLRRKHGHSRERRVYWSATATAGLVIFLGLLPDWKLGIGSVLYLFVSMSFAAYLFTPYFKVRGRIYAFIGQNRLSDSSPNGVSTPGVDDTPYYPTSDPGRGYISVNRSWWVMVIFCAMLEVSFIGHLTGRNSDFWGLLAPALFVVICLSLGYRDASGSYPIARGKRLQFGVATVMTAGCFAIFYLASYYAGKRWSRPYR